MLLGAEAGELRVQVRGCEGDDDGDAAAGGDAEDDVLSPHHVPDEPLQLPPLLRLNTHSLSNLVE